MHWVVRSKGRWWGPHSQLRGCINQGIQRTGAYGVMERYIDDRYIDIGIDTDIDIDVDVDVDVGIHIDIDM